MTELIKKAVEKIDKEAEEINHPYITRHVVQRIIDEQLINDENASKVLDDKKTLKQCIMHIYEEAKKQGQAQVSGKGAFVGGEDEDLWCWTCEYYGFTDLQSPAQNKIVNLFDVL